MTLTIFSTAAESSCDPAVPVSEEEPILITMRFAEVIAVRSIKLLFHPRRMWIFHVVLPLLSNLFIGKFVNFALRDNPC